MDEKKLGLLLVAIPVFQLASAALYIWAYCAGFGGNIYPYVSSGDVFTISLSDLLTIYVYTILVPLLTSLFRFFPQLQVVHPAPNTPEYTKNLKFFSILAVLVGLFVTALELFAIFYLGRTFNLMIIYMYAALLLPYWLVLFANRINANGLLRDAIVILPLFFISTVCVGFDTGSSERRSVYLTSLPNNTNCNGKVVLRRFSDRYLAIQPDNSHVLIDADCKVRFRIPHP